MRSGPFPAWASAVLVGGTFAVLVWLEHRRPLRPSVEPKLRRIARNLTVAAIGATAVQLAERPVVLPLARLVEARRWGIIAQANLPVWLEVPLACVLMDYTLYVWHVLVHRVPWLWRLHQVHHVDRDLDASTAFRFHFAELVASVPWRAGQVLLLGVSTLGLTTWQTAALISILFHHSNVRLPVGVERWLNLVLVTPRMHGIHHSIVPEETDSNWSSGLTLWDRLHGTLRLDVPQEAITIGVPAYHAPEDVHLPRLLVMPFVAQRPSWRWPDDGVPTRATLPAASAQRPA